MFTGLRQRHLSITHKPECPLITVTPAPSRVTGSPLWKVDCVIEPVPQESFRMLLRGGEPKNVKILKKL